jgi:hypothetical protein
MIHKTANRVSGADLAVEVIPIGSEISHEINGILALKEVEKKKYFPKQIVKMMRDEGWKRFTMDGHTKLWKRLGAKDPKKGFGVVAVGNLWGWYETWVKEVRKECEAHPELYGPKSAPAPSPTANVTTQEVLVIAARG